MTIQPLHLNAVTENPIVLLGEFHGNEQGPETLWTLSERIVGPITFALEYAESDDAIFHSWINSDGTDDDRRNLLKAMIGYVRRTVVRCDVSVARTYSKSPPRWC